MFNHLLEGRPKSDIVFYRAFVQDKKNKQSFASLKILLLINQVILISKLTNQTQSNDLFQTLLINVLVSLFGAVLQIAQLSAIYSKPQVFLDLAENSLHVVANQLTTNVSTIQDCVSANIFIGIGNLYERDLNEPTQKAYVAATLKALSIQLSSKYRKYASLTRFHSALSIASIVSSIITLVQQPNMDSFNKAFLIIYIVFVGLSELLIVIVLIIVALIPLLLIIFCFYVCCCRAKQSSGAVNLPVKNATMEDILNCDGTCSICYQNIGQNQEIYVLPCSEKHVFHKNCIERWSMVRNNCPICRAQIPTDGIGSGNLLSDQ